MAKDSAKNSYDICQTNPAIAAHGDYHMCSNGRIVLENMVRPFSGCAACLLACAYFHMHGCTCGRVRCTASELQELRKAIQKLECPTDPVQVAEYLESVREVRYRQLLVVVRDILPTTFLDMGDEQGAQVC